METRKPETIPADLEEVRQQFESWRNTHAQNGKACGVFESAGFGSFTSPEGRLTRGRDFEKCRLVEENSFHGFLRTLVQRNSPALALRILPRLL